MSTQSRRQSAPPSSLDAPTRLDVRQWVFRTWAESEDMLALLRAYCDELERLGARHATPTGASVADAFDDLRRCAQSLQAALDTTDPATLHATLKRLGASALSPHVVARAKGDAARAVRDARSRGMSSGDATRRGLSSLIGRLTHPTRERSAAAAPAARSAPRPHRCRRAARTRRARPAATARAAGPEPPPPAPRASGPPASVACREEGS